MKAIIVPSGGVSANGWVYPKEVLETAVEKLGGDISDRRFVGELKYDGYSSEGSFEVNLSRASHLVTDIFFDGDDNLVAEIELLETPQGKNLKEVVDLVVFRPRGIGNLTEEGTVADYKLISVDAVSKENDAFGEKQ